MYSYFKRSFIIFLFIVCFNLQTYSQGTFLKKDWIVRVSGGMSYLLTELETDFSSSYVEMNSLASGNYAFSIEKKINNNFDIAIEENLTTFNGYKNNPSNVNWMYCSYFNGFQPFPIEYKTNLNTLYLKGRYHFRPFYSLRKNYANTNMYCIGGIGWSSLGVCLAYKDQESYALTGLPSPLFGKGRKYQMKRTTYCSLMMGIGVRHYFSNRIAADLEVNFMGTNADCLDGIHNYSKETVSDGSIAYNRVPVFDIVTSFSAGISYHFHAKAKKAYLENDKQSSSWQSRKNDYINERYHERKNKQKNYRVSPFSFANK